MLMQLVSVQLLGGLYRLQRTGRAYVCGCPLTLTEAGLNRPTCAARTRIRIGLGCGDQGWAEEAVGRLHWPACTRDELSACTSSVTVIASDHYLFAGERPAFQLYLGTQSQTVSA